MKMWSPDKKLTRKIKVVRDWTASGLSGPKFAKTIGSSESTLYTWRRQVLKADPMALEPTPNEESKDKVAAPDAAEIARRRKNRTSPTQALVTLDEIRALEAEYMASNLTRRAFAQSKGIPVTQLDQWRTRLRRNNRIADANGQAESEVEEAAEKKGRKKHVRQEKISATAPSGSLRCPCCGCDVIAELQKLTMKLQAMAKIQL